MLWCIWTKFEAIHHRSWNFFISRDKTPTQDNEGTTDYSFKTPISATRGWSNARPPGWPTRGSRPCCPPPKPPPPQQQQQRSGTILESWRTNVRVLIGPFNFNCTQSEKNKNQTQIQNSFRGESDLNQVRHDWSSTLVFQSGVLISLKLTSDGYLRQEQDVSSTDRFVDFDLMPTQLSGKHPIPNVSPNSSQ